MSQIKTTALAMHALRVTAPAGILLSTLSTSHTIFGSLNTSLNTSERISGVPLAFAASVVLYLAAFALTHDLAHGALGLPRRLNAWALALSALPLLNSGHTMRLLHMKHHADPLSEGDIEGLGAQVSMLRSIWIGPANALAYRAAGLRTKNSSERCWQIVETAVTVVLAALALCSHTTAGATWVATMLLMQLTASFWASHLPHRPPQFVISAASHLLWAKSHLVCSLVLHEEHHARPHAPCGELAD